MMEQVQVEYDAASLEANRLKDVFELDGEALKDRIGALADAAFEEYRLEMSGLRSISTIREQRELRLYLLYKHFAAYGGLTDTQVGELFQMTRAQVATLIAGTWARYRPELESQLEDAIRRALEVGTWLEEATILRVVLPDSLAKHIRDLVEQTSEPPIEKVREVSQTYDVSLQTVESLCTRLDLPGKAILPKPKET